MPGKKHTRKVTAKLKIIIREKMIIERKYAKKRTAKREQCKE